VYDRPEGQGSLLPGEEGETAARSGPS
jgi:hypothetical protein